MKSKNIELDVDFIGGQDGLTSSEEKALSDFFKQQKLRKIPEKIKKGSKNKQIAAMSQAVNVS